MCDLRDVPIETPIPAREGLYVWSEQSEAWITWDQYIEETIFQPNAALREERRRALETTLF
jgi:hypothetical protein